MTDYRNIIDRELGGMTFAELRERSPADMRTAAKAKRCRRTAAALIALIAAAALAVLTVSASATEDRRVFDFFFHLFPWMAEDTKIAEAYSFSPEPVTEESTMKYNFALGDVICDGNMLAVQLLVTKEDGGIFTEKEVSNVDFEDVLLFPDIHDINGTLPFEGLRTGMKHSSLSDDCRTRIVYRKYTCLPRRVVSGDELYIRVKGAHYSGSWDYMVIDDGSTLIKFNVPEVPPAKELTFRDAEGNISFTAALTPISLRGAADTPVFEPDKDSVVKIRSDFNDMECIVYPRFLDENMEYTENVYNANVYFIDDDGDRRLRPADIYIARDECRADVVFGSDTRLDEAKYIKWFGCIAEIPEG